MASTKQAALAKARERRVELDRDRAARDGRIENLAAEVFVQQAARANAEQAAAAADIKIGAALRLLLEDGVAVEGVAQLCDLSLTEVRRLTRMRRRVDQAKSDPGEPVVGGDLGDADRGQRGPQVTALQPPRDYGGAGRSGSGLEQSIHGHPARQAE